MIAVLILGAQPPLQGLKCQRFGIVLPLKLQLLHCHIRHPAHRLATGQIDPCAHRTLALLQLPVLLVQILTQLRQVDVREVQIGLAAPALQPPFMH